MICVTGFEPFDGAAVNPSARLVAALQEAHPDVTGEVLPVDTQRIRAALERVLARPEITAVLCLGEARESTSVRVERVAVNLLDFEIPDASGARPLEEPVVVGGPSAYFCTYPARTIQEAICQAGVPAILSVGAGSYLCNQLLYLALHAKTGEPGFPIGFLHLPSLPEQFAGVRRPPATMDLAAQLRAVEAALGVLRRPNKKARP